MKEQLEKLTRQQFAPAEITRRVESIREELLQNSIAIDQPNFERISGKDLRSLFVAYDRDYFDGIVGKLTGSALTFRLSNRMTRVGGTTTVRVSRKTGERSYEIAIASYLLFKTFAGEDRSIRVNGLECRDRTDALQRVMEHELVHLVEMLVWQESSCSKPRFQSIATRLFGHTRHKHELVTPREIAAKGGLVPGRRVRFDFEGHTFEGVINRITKRATVLVEDAAGQRYSDGKHYVKYYIPLSGLTPADQA